VPPGPHLQVTHTPSSTVNEDVRLNSSLSCFSSVSIVLWDYTFLALLYTLVFLRPLTSNFTCVFDLCLILKELRSLPPSSMCTLWTLLLYLSIPDMPFPVLLSTLIRSRFQAEPATLLIPIAFSFPFRGGGALRYLVLKWLLSINLCGEWLSLPAYFSFL